MKRKLYFITALATLSLTNSIAQFTTTIPNLEAYYPLDGNLLDSSTNNYDLNTNTLVSYDSNRFGVANKAINSNSTSRIYKGSINNFPEFTFAFWAIPVSSIQTKQVLLSRTVYINESGTNNEIGKGGIFELYALTYGADSLTLHMSIHFGQTQQPTYTWEESYEATQKIAIGDWSHIGVTYSSASNTLKMYVNGTDAGTAVFSTPTNGQNSMTFVTTNINGYNTIGDMIVGGTTIAYWNGSSISYASAHLPFEGVLDDFYIFSRAITASEMASVKSMQDPSTAGMNEAAETAVSIFPNPTSDVMKVQLSSESNSAFSIYSADNREVMSGELNAGQNTINVQELAAGTYFLKTTINGTVVTKKISKQ